MSHESNDAEDNKTSEHTGHAVAHRHDDGVSVDIVVVVIVAGQGDHHAPGHADAEEYLSARISPDIDIQDPLPLRYNVELNTIEEAWQGGSSDQENEQDDVGKQCSHIDKLRTKLVFMIYLLQLLCLPFQLT